MNPRDLSTRLAALALGIVLLLLFYRAHSPVEKAKSQTLFEQWLTTMGPKIRNPKLDDSILEKVELNLRYRDAERGLTIDFDPSQPGSSSAKLLRLLEIARESDIFALKRTPEGEISLSLVNGSTRFDASFDRSDIAGNVSAQMFLKLMQLYTLPEESADQGSAAPHPADSRADLTSTDRSGTEPAADPAPAGPTPADPAPAE